MVLYRLETDDAIYIRDKPIIESNYKTFTPENLIKAVRNVRTGKLDIKTASKKHNIAARVIQRHMANWSRESDTDKIYTDETIKKHATTIICKTYAQFHKEFSKNSKLPLMTTRKTVTGAEKLDGIELLRSTIRSQSNGNPNIVRGAPKHLPRDEDEEQWVKAILDRLKANDPMTHQDMLETARQITCARGLNNGIPPRPWLYHMKNKYKPLFYGDQITIKIEVLDDKGIQFPIIYENPVLKYSEKKVNLKKSENSTIRKAQDPQIGCSSSVVYTNEIKSTQAIPITPLPVKLKYNFCRFCMASTALTIDRDIPDEFLRIFRYFYERELKQLADFPNKICDTCHVQFSEFVAYLQKVVDAQSKIKDLVKGRNVKIKLEQCESATINDSNLMTGDIDVKLEPFDESPNVIYLDIDMNNDVKIEDLEQLQVPTTSTQIQDENFKAPAKALPKKLKKIPSSKPKRVSSSKPKTNPSTSNSKSSSRIISNFSLNDFLNQSLEKRFECDICDFKTKKKVNLEGHIERTHLKNHLQDVQCSTCGIICKNLPAYSRHMVVAHPTTDAICDECGHVSKNLDTLRRHKKRMHGEQISCTVCGKLVPTYFLNLHMRVNHNPVKCSECGKVFSGKYKLRLHAQHVHENTSEVCPTCQSVFANKKKLNIHIQRQHPTALFHCPANSCNYNSSRKPYIRLHLNHHRDISDDEKERLLQSLKSLKAIPID